MVRLQRVIVTPLNSGGYSADIYLRDYQDGDQKAFDAEVEAVRVCGIELDLQGRTEFESPAGMSHEVEVADRRVNGERVEVLVITERRESGADATIGIEQL